MTTAQPPHPTPPLATADSDECWQLYQWATAAVASYSFVLGDDQYQVGPPPLVGCIQGEME